MSIEIIIACDFKTVHIGNSMSFIPFFIVYILVFRMHTNVCLNSSTHSPLLRHSLTKSSTLSWRVKHFNVIWRKFDQISQRSRLYNGRVRDQILFKIHWLYSLCQRNLYGEIQRGKERECENCSTKKDGITLKG